MLDSKRKKWPPLSRPQRKDKSKSFEPVFDLQVMKMILSEFEGCGVNTVGAGNSQSRHELDKNGISHQNLCICS